MLLDHAAEGVSSTRLQQRFYILQKERAKHHPTLETFVQEMAETTELLKQSLSGQLEWHPSRTQATLDYHRQTCFGSTANTFALFEHIRVPESKARAFNLHCTRQ